MSMPGEVGFWRGEVDNLHNDIEQLESQLAAAKEEINGLRARWGKATDFGEKQLARREELIAKLATQDKDVVDLKEFFDEAYKDAEYFESQLTAEREAKVSAKNFAVAYKEQRDAEHEKVKKLRGYVRTALRFRHAKHGHLLNVKVEDCEHDWCCSFKQALIDTEE